MASPPNEPAASPDAANADLTLAMACAAGDESAQRAFAERFGPDIDRLQSRFAKRIDRDDARQMVFSRLFVHDEGQPARVASFRGEGSLGAFVRAVALRVLLNAIERRTEELLGESMLDVLATTGDATTPETSVRHAEQRALLKAAFESAARALAPKERAILRYALVEGATIDAIGELYGVHRATAARWLERAKEALGRSMRAALSEATDLADLERDRLHASVASHLELSLERVLGSR